jgi:hypothetical protein
VKSTAKLEKTLEFEHLETRMKRYFGMVWKKFIFVKIKPIKGGTSIDEFFTVYASSAPP